MRDLQRHLRSEMTFTVVYKTGALTAVDDIYAVDDYFSSLLSPGGFKCVDTRMEYGIRVLTFKRGVRKNGQA
jgi:hypothetical protein